MVLNLETFIYSDSTMPVLAVKEHIGDYEWFLDILHTYIQAYRVDISNCFIDHICYRVDTQELYEQKKEALSNVADLLHESIVGGRLISIFKLHIPINYRWQTIWHIELPAPKEDHKYKDNALEHAEFVTPLSLQEIIDNHQHIIKHIDLSGLQKSYNKDIEIIFDPMCAMKFHHHSIDTIVAHEKSLYK